jgi:hypothetical protein
VATLEYSYAGARASAVPASATELIVTDRARSVWRRTSSRPAHAARFRSADRFMPDSGTSCAEGGWWELAPGVQIITPAMFGCGPAVADNAPGLTDFYAYLEEAGGLADHDGRFPVRGNIVMGGSVAGTDRGRGEGATIFGRLTLDVAAPIAGAVITNRMTRAMRIEGIAIAGGGSLAYADKLFEIGLLFDGAARSQDIEHLRIACAGLFGVFVRGHDGADRRFASRVGTGCIHGCGSGHEDSASSPAAAGAFLEAEYSLLTRGGCSGAYYQTTTFQLKPGFALPPPAIEDYGMLSFVRAGGEEFPVVCYDRSANRVTVWGWMPAGTAAADGRIGFVFGGGWGSAGGAGVEVGHLTVTASAIGYQSRAPHQAAIRVTAKHNYIGQTVGSGLADAAVSGATFGRFEGNNADIWYLASPRTRDAPYRVVADQAPGPSKVRFHSARRSDGSKVCSDTPESLTIGRRGEDHRYRQDVEPGGAGSERGSGGALALRGSASRSP